MPRSIALRAGCCLIVALAAFGQTKRLHIKNAGFIEGTVTESGDEYVVETKFGPVKIAKNRVTSIEEVVTPHEEYKKRLAEVDPNSAEEHYKLAKWAMKQGLLDEAHEVATAALKLRSDYQRASLLLRQIDARRQSDADSGGNGRKASEASLAAGGVESSWLVTDEEIAGIRLAELRSDDNVRVTFRNDVVNRFLEMMQGIGDFKKSGFDRTFRTWQPARKAKYMLDNLDRDNHGMRGDIVVSSDPKFMVEFRRRIWPTIQRRCGTGECHGGAETVGGFRVLNVAGRNVRVLYTNFLILDSYATSSGRRMIDRDHRDQSLLLQYGLPQQQAQYNHPVKITPVYTSRKSTNYRKAAEWIASLAGPPHPDYGAAIRVPWAPPKAAPAATTQPATAQPANAETE